MDNSKYWRKRYDKIEQEQNEKTVKYNLELEKKYKAAIREIEEKINAWYQRFAKNNNISIEDAKKLLTSDELEELKWDVEEYIKHGKENALDGLWMKQLENASAKFHISRLEALKIECQQSLEVATAGMPEKVDSILRDVYADTYYKSCFTVQKGIGVGFDVAKINDKLLDKLMKNPWTVDEKTFSDRIWTNKAKLINTLEQELMRMALTGDSPDKAIKSIEKAMNTSRLSAVRIVQTEQAYFTSLAQKDSYKELDVEEYEVVATLDGITCSHCGEFDGKCYPVNKMQAGINAPPFHPMCRCTTCPYFNDMDVYRATRDENGKTVFTADANLTYPEWLKMQGV